MKNFLIKISKPALTFFLGILLAAVVTSVLAHGGDTTLIHACVKTSSGSVRIVGANDTCNGNETALDWSNGITEPSNLPFICPGCNLGSDSIGDRLTGKDLTNSALASAVFVNTNLQNVNFTNTTFGGANFQDANLSGSNLSGITSSDAHFQNTNLTNVNFTNANLSTDTDMDTATLTGVIWSNTTCPDGTNSNDDGNTCVGHLTP